VLKTGILSIMSAFQSSRRASFFIACERERHGGDFGN